MAYRSSRRGRSLIVPAPAMTGMSGMSAMAGNQALTAGLVNLLQPQRETGFADGGTVATATDWSGLGNHCSAAGSVGNLLWRNPANGINGVPAYSLPGPAGVGGGQWLTCDALAAQFSQVGTSGPPFTVVQILKPSQAFPQLTFEHFMLGRASDSQVQFDVFTYPDAGSYCSDVRGNSHVNHPVGAGLLDVSTAAAQCFAFRYDGTSVSYFHNRKKLYTTALNLKDPMSDQTYDTWAWFSERHGGLGPRYSFVGLAGTQRLYTGAKTDAEIDAIMANDMTVFGVPVDSTIYPGQLGGGNTLYAWLQPQGIGYDGSTNGVVVADTAPLNFWGDTRQTSHGTGYNNSSNQGTLDKTSWGGGKWAFKFNSTATILGSGWGRFVGGTATPMSAAGAFQSLSTAADQCLFEIWDGTQNGSYMQVYLKTAGTTYAVDRRTGGSTTTVTGGTIDTAKHYYVFVYDGANVTLRIDGATVINAQPVGGGALTYVDSVVGGKTYNVGAGEVQSQFFNGYMRTFATWNGALSADDIANVESYLANNVM